MTPVRLGIVGLGHITRHAHLPPLAEMAEKGEVVLQAFCDVDENTGAELGNEWGAKAVYTDHRAMFDNEDLDGVYVCLPPTLHTDAELIAAEKGIALFVEKPQTLDLAQAVQFGDAIDKSGIVSQVGFMSRYYPSAECVVDLLQNRTSRHAQVQLWYSGKHVRYWTSRMALCGGSFVENTIHMVDLLRFFLGDIEAVSAFYFERKDGEGPEPINMPHVYNVNYRFKSGVVANALTSRVLTNVSHSRREVTVVADDALLEWSANKVALNGEAVETWDERPNPFAFQAQSFVDAVQQGDKTLMRSPYDNALNSLAAVLGANASAQRGGQPVLLDDMISGKVTWSPGEDIYMTVQELIRRFPEIPGDLHDESILGDFAEAFAPLLQVASKPSACAETHTDENKYYLKLIGPMDIYRYGLFTRERVLDEVQKLVDGHRENPEDFAQSLLVD